MRSRHASRSSRPRPSPVRLRTVLLGALAASFLLSGTPPAPLSVPVAVPFSAAPAATLLRPDLLVYGATPQGITAAVTASRQGLRVLLAEPSAGIGGVLTRSWLATLDMSKDGDNGSGDPLARGLFLDFFRQLGHDNSFDVHQAEAALGSLLRGSGVVLLTRTRAEAVSAAGGVVSAVSLRGPQGQWTARPARVIDATDNAGLAAAAGAPFTLGRADTGLDDAQMAAGLVFKVGGLDWPALGEKLRAEPGMPLSGRSLVGLTDVTSGYRPSDPSRFRLRGLNAARQQDGSLLINALLIYGVDGTSPDSLRLAHRQGAAEAARVVAYLRRSLPEVFGHAALGGVAPQVYVRESRHLLGEATLTATDVLYGAHFTDGVAVNAYPLDGQNYLPGQSPYLLGSPHPYEVPFGVMVPRGFTNLLVVSQAASFTSAAAFSARVVPLQMALGEAAGQASVLGQRLSLSYRTVARSPVWARALREWLSLRGARVSAPPAPDGQTCRDALDPAFARARSLLDRSLFSSPYYFKGCLHLEGPQPLADFVGDLQHALVTRQRQDPATVSALLSLRALYGDSDRALDVTTARSILGWLDYTPAQADALLPDLPAGSTLRRSQAVELLWAAEHRAGATGQAQAGSSAGPAGEQRGRKMDPLSASGVAE